MHPRALLRGMAAGLSIYCWCAAGDATAADRDSHEVMAVGWYVIFSRPSTMAEMTAFYAQTLGLPLMLSMRGPQNKDLFWGGEDIDVDVSHHGLELPLDPREADPDAARQIPFFRTDDLTAWLATLSARGAKVVAPRTTAHGRRMRARLEATGLRFPCKIYDKANGSFSYIADSEGNLIGLADRKPPASYSSTQPVAVEDLEAQRRWVEASARVAH